MTNREKLTKTNIYDLMMTIQDTGCPIWIKAGLTGFSVEKSTTVHTAAVLRRWTSTASTQ